MEYSIADGALEIREPERSGTLTWRGSFEGEVFRAAPLPGTDDCIVIVEYQQGDVHNNVFRVGPDGEIVWRAESAPEYGAYTDVKVEGDHISAYSWSGYRVTLDWARGTIIDKLFVK